MPHKNMTNSDMAGDDDFDLSAELDDLLASISPKHHDKAEPDFDDGKSDKRRHYRHPVHWHVAIVDKSDGSHNIYHGRTHSVSMTGISILLERSVQFSSEVVALLAIPPMINGHKETIVEIQCRLLHTVLDSEHQQFRLGMKVIRFKRDGKKVLSNILSKRHITKPEDIPYITGYKSG